MSKMADFMYCLTTSCVRNDRSDATDMIAEIMDNEVAQCVIDVMRGECPMDDLGQLIISKLEDELNDHEDYIEFGGLEDE